MNRPRRVLILSGLLVLMLAATAAAAPAPVVAPGVATALADPAFAGRNADGTVAVWVWFRDKGLAGAELDAALDRAQADLDDHARARRAKMDGNQAGPGKRARLVDATDLPVAAAHLDAASATGARLRRVSRWLNAASFDVDATQVAALAALPQVRSVTLVRRALALPAVTTSAPAGLPPLRTDSAQWSINYGGNLEDLEQISVPQVHDAGYHGQGVIIGMLDSGFRTTHECLSPLPVLARWDFVDNDGVVENQPGDPSDQDSHGTMTMSTIAGYAPGSHVGPAFGATLVLAKTEDVSQEVPAEEDNWVAGIEWLDTFGVDVVSSSLGYIDWFTFADLDGNTAACTIAADLAVGKGIVVCNSAGNERGGAWNHIVAPADGDSVIAVGAVTSSGTYSSFSSPGPSADGRIKPDICALGSGNHVASVGTISEYETASGTSFSCPLSAGVAALVLSRVPSLTPLQVREAMRATASRAGAPDNDYGWGILDAYDAVFYFGAAIGHAPLGDTESTAGGYTVTATITDRLTLDPAQLQLHWRANGGAWQAVALAAAGADTWTAVIPAQASGADVDYYLSAGDTAGIVTTLPIAGAAAPFAFHVGPDATAPVVTHVAIGDQPLLTWPAQVRVHATDNLGVAAVTVDWELNGAPQSSFALAALGGGDYAAAFPVAAASLATGDTFTYTVTATDSAAAPNTAGSGPHTFAIIDALGVALVIDDTTAAKSAAVDEKYDADKRPLAPAADKAAPADLDRWLRQAGYVTRKVAAADVVVADFAGPQFVVLTSGANTAPVASAALRTLVQDWAAAGGKLIVEGGEVGYDAISSPGYPAFASGVLHATAWRADSAGALQVAQASHPLAMIPHALPATLSVTYGGYGDEDGLTAAADATVVFDTAGYPGAAGVLAYDDDNVPQAGQVVVLAFNVGALADTTAARHLVENAAAWLLADQGAASASLHGHVVAVNGGGSAPLAGATVSLGAGHSTTTAADGSYLLADLYAGAYTLTVAAPGVSALNRALVLGEGQSLRHDVQLYAVATADYARAVPVAIPDDNATGITSVINVPLQAEVSGITVDIALTHTWRGDLTVSLTSPGGTTVRLHNRTGSSADNINGTYGTTLTVDGPGTLADFTGDAAYGNWTLFVSDTASTDTGTLNSWGLHLTYALAPSATPGTPMSAFRLLPNRPNPFNPRTEIRFELARAGSPRLAIYDLRGSRVRELLADQPLEAGAHAVIWDGRDDGGREVASGLYLSRLEADGAQVERKLMLVR